MSIGPTGHPGHCLPRNISELEVAISREDQNLVKQLLTDVNEILTPDGDRPIHIASKYNNIAIMALLLERGSNVNSLNHWMMTPLMYASSYGHYEMVQFLLEHGADYKLRNYWKGTAKKCAGGNGHQFCVDLLSTYQF